MCVCVLRVPFLVMSSLFLSKMCYSMTQAASLSADYVQRFARPEAMLGRNGVRKDSDDGEDNKMDGGEGKGNESEGFLSSSSDDES